MITASVRKELRTNNNKKTFWKSIRHATNNIINFFIHSVFYLSILLTLQIYYQLFYIIYKTVVTTFRDLIISWRRSLSWRNQSIDLHLKTVIWFLYVRDLCHERGKSIFPRFKTGRPPTLEKRLQVSFFLMNFAKFLLMLLKRICVGEKETLPIGLSPKYQELFLSQGNLFCTQFEIQRKMYYNKQTSMQKDW